MDSLGGTGSRLTQIKEWLQGRDGNGEDALIIFDECHVSGEFEARKDVGSLSRGETWIFYALIAHHLCQGSLEWGIGGKEGHGLIEPGRDMD